MKIGQNTDKTAIAPTGNGQTAAATSTPAAATATATTAIPSKADDSAKIKLSNTASTLLQTGSTPEFDAEKVARISKAIDDGSFKIDPAAIADKLISNAKELLTRAQN